MKSFLGFFRVLFLSRKMKIFQNIFGSIDSKVRKKKKQKERCEILIKNEFFMKMRDRLKFFNRNFGKKFFEAFNKKNWS